MAKIIGGISMSHAPGATGWPELPPKNQQNNIKRFHEELEKYLERAKPDLIIAFLDDHFENYFRKLNPLLAVAVADNHRGPAAHLIKALGFDRTIDLRSDKDFGEILLRGLVNLEFDITRVGSVEFGNNLMTPLKLIRPAFDIPVVPVYINVFTPPVVSMKRAFDLGRAVRKVILDDESDRRVFILGTGGLSHWPPVWTESAPDGDDFLQRMKKYQTEGASAIEKDPDLYVDQAKYEIEMAAKNEFPLNSPHPLINEEWDRKLMAYFEKGDVNALTKMTTEEVERDGGHGGHEMLNWMAVMGAFDGQKAKVVGYEPVLEWVCGMGYLRY